MITIFIRTAVLYICVVMMMRMMGKRVLGQLQPFELVVTILIADLAAAPISDLNAPLLYGVVPIAALLFMSSVFSILQIRSESFRRMVTGRPTVITAHGVIDHAALKKTCISLPELLESYRKAGYMHPADVKYAILETDGSISVFPAQNTVVNKRGLPISLILDGEIQRENLLIAKVDISWLKCRLDAMGLTERDVLMMLLDDSGAVYVEDYAGIIRT